VVTARRNGRQHQPTVLPAEREVSTTAANNRRGKRYNQQSTGGSRENTTAKPALTAAAEDEVATTPNDVSLMNGRGTRRTMMMPRFHPACQTAEAWEWMAIPWQISFWTQVEALISVSMSRIIAAGGSGWVAMFWMGHQQSLNGFKAHRFHRCLSFFFFFFYL